MCTLKTMESILARWISLSAIFRSVGIDLGLRKLRIDASWSQINFCIIRTAKVILPVVIDFTMRMLRESISRRASCNILYSRAHTALLIICTAKSFLAGCALRNQFSHSAYSEINLAGLHTTKPIIAPQNQLPKARSLSQFVSLRELMPDCAGLWYLILAGCDIR